MHAVCGFVPRTLLVSSIGNTDRKKILPTDRVGGFGDRSCPIADTYRNGHFIVSIGRGSIN